MARSVWPGLVRRRRKPGPGRGDIVSVPGARRYRASRRYGRGTHHRRHRAVAPGDERSGDRPTPSPLAPPGGWTGARGSGLPAPAERAAGVAAGLRRTTPDRVRAKGYAAPVGWSAPGRGSRTGDGAVAHAGSVIDPERGAGLAGGGRAPPEDVGFGSSVATGGWTRRANPPPLPSPPQGAGGAAVTGVGMPRGNWPPQTRAAY